MAQRDVRTHLRRLSVLTCCALISVQALASAVTLLDTFPASGVPDSEARLGFNVKGRNVALPFSTNAPGTITRVETGIKLFGTLSLCGWNVGIVAAADLLGYDRQLGFTDNPPWKAYKGIRSSESAYGAAFCSSAIPFTPSQSVDLPDLNWFLERGDYFLVATSTSDIEFATWGANASLVADEWAIQALEGRGADGDYLCGGFGGQAPWTTLKSCGLAAAPTPAARITFEPGLRLPEPGTLLLLAGAIVMLAVQQVRAKHQVRR
jgi:hypothetical protein